MAAKRSSKKSPANRRARSGSSAAPASISLPDLTEALPALSEALPAADAVTAFDGRLPATAFTVHVDHDELEGVELTAPMDVPGTVAELPPAVESDQPARKPVAPPKAGPPARGGPAYRGTRAAVQSRRYAFRRS